MYSSLQPHVIILFQQLAWQLLGITVIVAWTGVTCGIMFVCLRLAGVLRVPFEYEIKGNRDLGISLSLSLMFYVLLTA